MKDNLNEKLISVPQPPVFHTSSRFLYDEWVRLSKRLEIEELNEEERVIIEQKRSALFKEYEVASNREQAEPEAIGLEFLENLKYAIKQKDKALLRKTILMIQEFVNRPNFYKDLDFIRFADDELDKILNNRIAAIIVGSGTYGQRILISSSRLRMSGDRHGQEYRNRFAKLFGLKFDPNIDLSIEF